MVFLANITLTRTKKNVSELEKKVYNFDTKTGEKTMMKCCCQYHKSFYIHATATISWFVFKYKFQI